MVIDEPVVIEPEIYEETVIENEEKEDKAPVQQDLFGIVA